MVIGRIGACKITYIPKTSGGVVAMTRIRGWKEQSVCRKNLGTVEILGVVTCIASSLSDEVIEVETGGIEASAGTYRSRTIAHAVADPSHFRVCGIRIRTDGVHEGEISRVKTNWPGLIADKFHARQQRIRNKRVVPEVEKAWPALPVT